MEGFEFYIPTRIIFGRGTEMRAGEEIKKLGGTRAMIHYGGGSAEKSGLLSRVLKSLTDAGLSFVLFGGAQPNPRISHVYKGVALGIREKVDFVLAVGGGSVIDSSKAIALGIANPQDDVWDYYAKKAVHKHVMPVGCILTIAAAGSEMSVGAVITNEKEGLKRGYSGDFQRPRFAILNPELTYTLPRFQIAAGATDIYMHTLDRYFSTVTTNEMTDAIAESLMRVVIRNGPIALREPDNYQAQSELMWCGSLSHNNITGLGAPMDFSVHQFGHELSGMFDVNHGASLATMWAWWARYCHKANPRRFVQYGESVWGISPEGDAEEIALCAIEKTEAFFRSLGMPTCFTELGIGVLSEAKIDKLVEKTTFFGARSVGVFKPLDAHGIKDVYMLANH